ncbi:MAG: lysozyme inhibitor LprI family protein [Neisseria sp.]|nr:lysozyme inhibitor LprI family protein [Neisseria sp.]
MKPIIFSLCISVCAGLAYAKCDDLPTVELAECVDKEGGQIERKLAATYKKAAKRGGKKLVAAQKWWVRYKEADCDAQAAQYEGGSMWGIVYRTCLNSKAAARERELRQTYLSGY